MDARISFLGAFLGFMEQRWTHLTSYVATSSLRFGLNQPVSISLCSCYLAEKSVQLLRPRGTGPSLVVWWILKAHQFSGSRGNLQSAPGGRLSCHWNKLRKSWDVSVNIACISVVLRASIMNVWYFLTSRNSFGFRWRINCPPEKQHSK